MSRSVKTKWWMEAESCFVFGIKSLMNRSQCDQEDSKLSTIYHIQYLTVDLNFPILVELTGGAPRLQTSFTGHKPQNLIGQIPTQGWFPL